MYATPLVTNSNNRFTITLKTLLTYRDRRDSGLKLCTGCWMPKITIRITCLSTEPGGIEEPIMHWGPSVISLLVRIIGTGAESSSQAEMSN